MSTSPALPTRFRHPLDDPDPRGEEHYRRFLGRAATPPLRAQADRLGVALLEGDPLADAFIEASQPLGRARANALVEAALAGGVDAAARVAQADGVLAALPPLRALFASLESVPLWVDPAALDLGCRAFRRAGPLVSIVLSGFSLMGGYRSSAVVKPLMRTGKLQYTASRRLLETGRFVLAVTQPGGMVGRGAGRAIGQGGTGGAGYQEAVRVRLIHAAIRHALRSAPDWDTHAWGVPINQADMLGTNLLFSMGFLSGCRSLGLRFSRVEADAIVHLWRYVGTLLGIGEALLPANESEAARIFYLVGASQPPPDADSVALAQALHHEPLDRATNDEQRRAARVEMALRAAFSRLMLGDGIADELGLPRGRADYGVRALVPLIAAFDAGRASTRAGTDLAYRMGARWLETAIGAQAAQGNPHVASGTQVPSASTPFAGPASQVVVSR